MGLDYLCSACVRSRVLDGVFDQFVGYRSGQVNVAVIGHLQQVQQHIGHFVGNVCFGGRVQVRGLRFFGGHPLEYFEQFGGFDHQRCAEVLGCVKWLPVARGGKVAQAVL